MLTDIKENCNQRAARNGYPVENTAWDRVKPAISYFVGVVLLAIVYGIIRSIVEG